MLLPEVRFRHCNQGNPILPMNYCKFVQYAKVDQCVGYCLLLLLVTSIIHFMDPP